MIRVVKAYCNQLPRLLDRGLAPFYLVSGEEPLQQMEAADLIRARARAAGYGQREFFFVAPDFDWDALDLAADNLSLFCERRFIEVRVVADKPPARAAAFFNGVLEAPPQGVLFLVQARKVDGRAAWVRRVVEHGVWIQVYEKSLTELRSWLGERMLRRGLVAGGGVVEFLAARVEGNLLAAAQEVEKLRLVCGEGRVAIEDVERVIADSAHYNVYDLADAAAAGERLRAVRVLQGLRAEAAPEPLVLWALADQLRRLIALERRVAEGAGVESLLRTVWKKKQPVYRKALARGLGRRWWVLLHACHEADKAIKGRAADDAWHELLRLVLRMAGAGALRRAA